jgi:integrase/recombinase XerD
MWHSYIKGFKAYLMLERSMSDNTVEAYLRDVGALEQYLGASGISPSPESITLGDLRSFLQEISELELSHNTQARMVSGVKSFFQYLLLEEVIKDDPTELLESPKSKRALPHVLSIEEIDSLFQVIDHSTQEGVRNRAMLETMYSCGLRVSELISLKISKLYLDVGLLTVIGKGNKERIVPIGGQAIKHIALYKDHIRSSIPTIKAGHEDNLFLNRRGASLSRVMMFLIVKDLASRAGIVQSVHPHTFRHSFATHLVEAGADLRAVQEMLGHKSITTTEIYTHLDNTFLRQTLEKYHPLYRGNRD